MTIHNNIMPTKMRAHLNSVLIDFIGVGANDNQKYTFGFSSLIRLFALESFNFAASKKAHL